MLLPILSICVLFFTTSLWVFSCAIQPDIIHEFRINTASGETSKIHYTLMSWRSLHPEILNHIKNASVLDSQPINLN